MDCKIKDFYISNIMRVAHIDQTIYPNNYVEYRNTLNWDELIFFKDTFATIYFDDFIFNIEPNDILFLPSGQHEKYIVKLHKPGAFTDIYFISNIHLNSTATIYKSPTRNINVLFHQALTIWQQNPELNHAKTMSILWDLIYKIQTSICIPNAQSKLIEPAVEYIFEHYRDTDIAVHKLATKCGMSYSLFLKTFEQRFSTTPKNYIINLKMNDACEMLKANKTITEISEDLNFTDVYFFSKQFKKHVGVSPSTYRRKLKQNNEFFNIIQPHEKV